MGPSVNNEEMVHKMMDAGMNVARLNFSHGTHSEHGKTIAILKKVRKQRTEPLAILLDNRGPEVRIGEIEAGAISLKKGQEIFLSKKRCVGNKEAFFIAPASVLDKCNEGTKILFNDGYISAVVLKKTEEGLLLQFNNSGVISSSKGVNIPGVSLDLPSLTQQDIEDITFGCAQGVDFIAASFIRSAENIVAIKNLLLELNAEKILVLAKIESREGVKNFDSILQVADGIMVARGDLGVELPLSQVPCLQKQMIRKCYLAGKPAITATQMLESMISNPRPTRAEASDVANAIYDSTSAVMLSAETAIGQYPIETIEMMTQIIEDAEADFDYKNFFLKFGADEYNDVSSSISLAAVKTAYSSHAAAIFTLTSLGTTAHLIARLRPPCPIVALTPNELTYHQLSLNWGVIPVLGSISKSFSEAFEKLSRFALDHHIVNYGDLIVATGGSTLGITGTTNMMIVENIGNVLVRGHTGIGKRLWGKIILAITAHAVSPFKARGSILVLPRCDESYLELIKESAGIILQNEIRDTASEEYLLKIGKEYNKSVIVRADAAMHILKEGQLVTLVPEKALLYKGVFTD
jgi:pyruvate kinase